MIPGGEGLFLFRQFEVLLFHFCTIRDIIGWQDDWWFLKRLRFAFPTRRPMLFFPPEPELMSCWRCWWKKPTASMEYTTPSEDNSIIQRVLYWPLKEVSSFSSNGRTPGRTFQSSESTQASQPDHWQVQCLKHTPDPGRVVKITFARLVNFSWLTRHPKKKCLSNQALNVDPARGSGFV